ncbi:MAG: sporulation protein [Oscillospiraceae bacterium]|nr:sporulation protein [Oscillospiraceae bacterium]
MRDIIRRVGTVIDRPRARNTRPLIDLLLIAAIIISSAGLLIQPQLASLAAREGISLCLDIIVPSLFPFFVLSTLFVELGSARYLGNALEGVMRPLFRLNGACSAAVVLGFIGGYPVGARTAIALYEKGNCTKTEAERLLSFCNNSGPAFILGAVGAGIFGGTKAGWLLYGAHILASLTVGLIFRFYKYREPIGESARNAPERAVRLSTAFTESVRSSFYAMFNVCAFVIFFAVTIRMLYTFEIMSATPFAAGLIEVTSGLWMLKGLNADVAQRLAMAAFMLGWAGVSIHCQVLSFIGESGLRSWTYITGKLLHGGISSLYILIILRVFNFGLPVSSYLMEQVDKIARLDFSSALSGTLKVSFILTLGFAFLIMLSVLTRQTRE